MIDSMPLVTVGIPTFNRPKGLERILGCILNQTYRNLEVIISDNHSEVPEVLEILEKYKALDQRVSFFIQDKNISIIPNFQFLLNKAKGEFFMWAADDDYYDSNFIEACLNALNDQRDIVLCMTDLKFVTPDGKQADSKLNRSFMQRNLFSRCFHFVKSTGENKFFFCGLYRSSAVKNIVFNNSWGGDHMFLYEAITKGKFLHISKEADFYYSKSGSSSKEDSIRKAFGIKRKHYFFDAYILRYTIYQFRFKHLRFFTKLGLFFSNAAALIFQEDFILYYIFIKKPIRSLIKRFQKN